MGEFLDGLLSFGSAVLGTTPYHAGELLGLAILCAVAVSVPPSILVGALYLHGKRKR